jgi:hypothetical protein
MERVMNKTANFFKIKFALLAVIVLGACNLTKDHRLFNASNIGPVLDAPSNTRAAYVAGIGANVSGTGALTVPTLNATIKRISLGVNGKTSKFFAAAVFEVTTNLSNSTDPTQFSGADANMQLAYSACADVGGATYGVILKNTASSNRPALIAAGVNILDQFMGGLASQGSASSQISSAVGGIVDKSIAGGTNSQIAFMTVCTAALTAGSTMLGF